MLRISSRFIFGQNYLDDLNLDQGVDWESDFQPEKKPDNWDQYIVDDIEDPNDEEFADLYEPEEQLPEEIPGTQVLEEGEPVEQEEPTALDNGEMLEPEAEYPNIHDLLKDSMGEPPHLIKFDYTSIKGRFTTNRVVQPHRIFTARTTGNRILLTLDTTVGNSIRGFVINQIKPYGILYKNTFIRDPYLMKERIHNQSGLAVHKI